MTAADVPEADERTRHLVQQDPGGCWVAEDESGLVGTATSFRRETLWCLATYAVLPHRQGQGIGKPLLAAALAHGRACTRAMLSTSADTRATRVLRQAGFDLHPQMSLSGVVDRSVLPVPTPQTLYMDEAPAQPVWAIRGR